MRYYSLIMTLAIICSSAFTKAKADELTDTTSNIVEAILASDAEVIIVQPDGLADRLAPNAVIKSTGNKKQAIDPSVRYRVQVYSDNNRQTAKANAEYRKRLIEQRMPGVLGYVTYDAPYWRVRIGNYQTEAEAYNAMKQIKSQFPAFSSDIRVVKVRVNN